MILLGHLLQASLLVVVVVLAIDTLQDAGLLRGRPFFSSLCARIFGGRR